MAIYSLTGTQTPHTQSRLLMRAGVVHYTLVSRIGASYSAPFCSKEAGCCGQVTLEPVSNACQEQAGNLVVRLEPSGEPQIGA